jgi:hypothetical protein
MIHIVQSVDEKICERWCFTISELPCEFPQIAHTGLYEIITVRLGCQKFCARWVPKMLMGAHKMQIVASTLTFSKRYHKDGDKFQSHHTSNILTVSIQVTSDETRVSFVNVETKAQPKQWMHTHSPNKPKHLNKHSLPAIKLMTAVSRDRKGVLMVEFVQQEATV